MSVRIDKTQTSAAYIKTIIESNADKYGKREKIRQIMLVLIEEMFIMLPEGNAKNASFKALNESLQYAYDALENIQEKNTGS